MSQKFKINKWSHAERISILNKENNHNIFDLNIIDLPNLIDILIKFFNNLNKDFYYEKR